MGKTGAIVTSDPEQALASVAGGVPAVLVGGDPAALGRALGRACGGDGGPCLLGVMVGDLSSPAVCAAALEMARELWPWAAGGPG